MEKRGAGQGVVRAAMIIMAAAVGWLTITATAKPILHKVGGSAGWKQNINYTSWSSTRHFHLDFSFDKRYYNVLEVNKTSYESCMDRDFMKNVTRGGRDVYELREARPYYFLSGGGYCYHGMRVAISVIADHHDQLLPPTGSLAPAVSASALAQPPAPAPALAPHQNASPFL
ncbi:Cupredoxin [Trema orientale]|uniref:Cupredoxin n=1 Tax=Trema orientale TaxID=63057 RepID=A0A2P5FEW8_TREOI|nr:Cupredoxin [Trema orientale]